MAFMRMTVTLEDDVAAEISRLRREQGLGPNEALNLLARRGLAAGSGTPARFQQRSLDLGARVDVANIGEVLGELDEAGLSRGAVSAEPDNQHE